MSGTSTDRSRLRSILETVPDAMIIIDDRGRIESLSTTAQKLFGYPLAELAGLEGMVKQGQARRLALR